HAHLLKNHAQFLAHRVIWILLLTTRHNTIECGHEVETSAHRKHQKVNGVRESTVDLHQTLHNGAVQAQKRHIEADKRCNNRNRNLRKPCHHHGEKEEC